MNNWAPETTALIHSLGWALCHSLWQSLLIFAVLKAVLKFVPSSQPGIRYNVALAGLLGMTIWFVDTWIQQWYKLKSIVVLVTETPVSNHIPATTHTINTTLPKGHIRYDIVATFINGLEQWFPVLVCIYICGLVFLLLRFCLNLFKVNQLRSNSVTEAPEDVYSRLFHWQEQLGISRKVRLLYSARVNVPMMLGTIKPIILFPLATASRLSTEQLEAILLHELAHIKRYDYLVNMLQTIIETILFFNPFAWLASRIIRTEREHCCDDVVLAHTYPLAYAKALASLETSRFASNSLSMGAAGTSKNHLLTRIKRIMELKPNQTTDSRIVAMTLVAGVMLVSLICFSPSFAQDKKEKKAEPKKKQTRMWINDATGMAITGEDGKTYTTIEDMPQEARRQLYEENKKNNTTIYYGKDGKKLVAKGDSIIIERAPDEVDAFVDDKSKSGVIVEDYPTISKAEQIEEEFGKAFMDIDWSKLSADIDKAMKEVDWEKVDKDIKTGLKEAESALNEIDWKEIERQIEAAGKMLDSIDYKKIRSELDRARLETRKAMVESRKAMIESRRALTESRLALAESRRAIEQSRAGQMRAEMELRKFRSDEKHKRRLTDTEIMFGRMIEDNIVDTSKDYTLSMTPTELIVNRRKLPPDIHERYLPYIKNSSFTSTKRSPKTVETSPPAQIKAAPASKDQQEANSHYDLVFQKIVEDYNIDTSGDYFIKISKKELIVNDKKQPKQLHKKYSKYAPIFGYYSWRRTVDKENSK